MRVPKLLLILCLLVAGTLAFTQSAHATPLLSVPTVTFGTEGHFTFYGMDDSGNVVFQQFDDPCTGSHALNPTCYFSYLQDGTFLGLSDSAPAFTPDNGTACALPAGWFSYKAACNNGFEAIDGSAAGDPADIYFGTTANPTEFSLVSGLGQIGGSGQIFINSQGFVVFDDAFGEYWMGFQDTAAIAPTPEPSSLILLGTGALGLVGAARRRLITRS